MRSIRIPMRLAMATAIAFGGGLAHAADADAWSVADTTLQAYTHALPAAAESFDLEAFLRGRTQFRRAWIDGRHRDTNDGRGLGPLYNRLSCIACHPANGRGRAPAGPDERMQSMLVRLSIPGQDATGGPRPHPFYGGQFNEEGVAPVPGEGRVFVQWQAVVHRQADGNTLALRRPALRFEALAYGPMSGVLTSARVGPSVFGLGLLEAVPEAALLTLAHQAAGDGVHGTPNRVWDSIAQRATLGRFGWKANTATLTNQIVGAANGDLGLASDVVPGANCAPRQAACLAAARDEGIELDAATVRDMDTYLRHLAPPAPRYVGHPVVERGRALFTGIGCARCHRDSLPLGPDAPAGLAGTTIAPYTDLMLHDMGAGLADGRPDFLATGRQWRTPPLWGIGLVGTVNEHTEFLHDGRARNLAEAIAWHGGEATRIRRRYERLPGADRAALLRFLESL